MSTSSDLTVKMVYTDATSRNYTLPNVSNDITEHVRATVKSINEGTATNVNDFKATFVSDNGASVASISEVSLTTTTEEEIYNANS